MLIQDNPDKLKNDDHKDIDDFDNIVQNAYI